MSLTDQFIRRKLRQGAYRLGGDDLPNARRDGFSLTQRNGFSAAASRRRGGAAGPDTWYDVETAANAASAAALGTTYVRWAAVTIAQAGSATKIRYLESGSITNEPIKVGLYNADGDLVTNGSATVTGASGYKEIDITPTSVSSGTYYIAIAPNTGNPGCKYKNAVGTWYYKAYTTPYSVMPLAALAAEDGTVARNYALSVYVD